jgi:hypothetical protein
MPANSTPLLIQGRTSVAALPAYCPIRADGYPAAAGEAIIGVTAAAATAGSRASVVVDGSAEAWAGGAITNGDELQVGAGNTVVKSTGGAMIGIALNDAGVGDKVEVLLHQRSLSASAAQAVQALISTAGITTWSNRAAVVAAGLTTAFFTDVGIGGTYYDYVGSKWRPQSRRAVLKNLVSSLSHNSGPKIVISEATLLPGLLQDGDSLVVEYIKTKEGGTTDTETTDFLVGATSGTLGTSLALTTGALSTITQQVASRYVFRRESATTIRPISITGPQGIGSSTAAPAGVITVPNMDSQTTYLQISGDMTTGGGAETVYLRGFSVELVAGA